MSLELQASGDSSGWLGGGSLGEKEDIGTGHELRLLRMVAQERIRLSIPIPGQLLLGLLIWIKTGGCG